MAEKPGYESLQQMKLKENPKEAANVLSVLSFSWMNNVFAVGNRRPLENDDLLPLINEDKTQTCTKKLIQAVERREREAWKSKEAFVVQISG